MVRLVLGLAVAFPLALAGDAGDPVERARAAASALASELMQRLGRELSAGGPARAVDVCSAQEQDLRGQADQL